MAPLAFETLGVGSCVVVCLYDSIKKIGGMAHMMLPRDYTHEDIQTLEIEGILHKDSPAEAQHIDVALDWMIEEMETRGTDFGQLTARIIGGAEMFPGVNAVAESLGLRNILSARRKLTEWRIPILTEYTGGNHGRAVKFFLEDGQVIVE